MKVTALLTQSFRSIWNNKIRSSLTILGVVIGIAAVLLLMGLGNSLKANIISQVGNLDATRVLISSKDPEQKTAERKGGRFSFDSTSGLEKLTEADYQAIKNLESVTTASPESNATIDVSTSANASTATAYQLYGVDESYFHLNKYPAQQGKLFSSAEIQDKQNVVLLGSKAAEKIFPGITQVSGQIIYMKDIPYTVIGVIGEPQSTNAFMNDISMNLYVGYKKWGDIQEKTTFGSIQIQAADEKKVDQLTKDLEKLLLGNHKISDASKADFTVNSNKALLSTLSNVGASFAKTLTGIATISLIVGGIGIMNIMLVTVTERTREIGLRRAVGAKKRHIIMQFLTESVLLTTLGGLLGVLVGVGLNRQASEFFSNGLPGTAGNGVHIFIDLPTIMLAVAVAVLTGIIFGIFPAIKAARLAPVDSLRYE